MLLQNCSCIIETGVTWSGCRTQLSSTIPEIKKAPHSVWHTYCDTLKPYFHISYFIISNFIFKFQIFTSTILEIKMAPHGLWHCTPTDKILQTIFSHLNSAIFFYFRITLGFVGFCWKDDGCCCDISSGRRSFIWATQYWSHIRGRDLCNL